MSVSQLYVSTLFPFYGFMLIYSYSFKIGGVSMAIDSAKDLGKELKKNQAQLRYLSKLEK